MAESHEGRQGALQGVSTSPDDFVVEAVDLHKSYPPRKVLRGVTTSMRAGEIVGLLGLNGAGKTTFVKLLAGLLRPDSGQIRLMGKPITHAAVRQHVALMKEGQPSLSEFMSPMQCLLYYGHLLGIEDVKKKAVRALELASLTHVADTPLLELSFGTKRRTGLALAYLKGARLLLLDEASAGLDVKSVATLRSVLKNYASMGNTVLLTGHEMGFMEAVCDRVILLHEGTIVADGKLHELSKKYALKQQVEVWYEGEPILGEVVEVHDGLARVRLQIHDLGSLDPYKVRYIRLYQSVLENLLQEVGSVES